MDRVIELSGFPIRHPHASMRSRVARQVTGMQAIAGLEFDKVGHRCSDKMCTGRPALFPHVHIGFHHRAIRVHVIAIQAGSVVVVQSNDFKMSGGSGVSLPASRYARIGDNLTASAEKCFLLAQIHHDGGFTFMKRREI